MDIKKILEEKARKEQFATSKSKGLLSGVDLEALTESIDMPIGEDFYDLFIESLMIFSSTQKIVEDYKK